MIKIAYTAEMHLLTAESFCADVMLDGKLRCLDWSKGEGGLLERRIPFSL